MATTFKISNGDVVVNTSTGRSKLIGNEINESNGPKAKEKANQDLKRSLSITRLRDGSGAGLAEIVGNTDAFGITSTQILLNKRIRQMFGALVFLQNKRRGIRPLQERFSNISLLRIFSASTDKTQFRFRLDVRTRSNENLVLAGRLR
jgi:hypothetical protein